VRDVKDGDPALAEPAKDTEQGLGLVLRQGRRGLIENDQPRRQGVHACDLDQLLLSHGELADGRIRVQGQVDSVKDRLHISPKSTPIDPPDTVRRVAAGKDILGDREIRKQAELLVDHPDATLSRSCRVAQRELETVKKQRSGVWRLCPRKHLHECRLAGAVFAYDRVNLPLTCDKVDLGESLDPWERLADSSHLEQRARLRGLCMHTCYDTGRLIPYQGRKQVLRGEQGAVGVQTKGVEERSPRIPAELDDALLSSAYLRDPYPIYARLRDQAPVAWSEAFRSWLLTRHEDVLWALREPRLTTGGRMHAFLKQLAPEDRSRAEAIDDHYASTLPFLDPPRHTVVKALVQKAFSLPMVEGLHPAVQELVDGLLDDMEGDEVDLMSQLAQLLPIHVIGTMLGVPKADRARFRPWTNHIFAIFSSGRAITKRIDLGRENLLEMREYLRAVIDERRREPRNDLISQLVRVSEDGETLSAGEVLANCVTLYTAGHETTSGLIGNAFLALFRHREQLQMLLDNSELIGSAVEECLRYDTSVQRAWRLAATDIEYQGCMLPRGDIVSPMVAAANRDPARFPDPDRFDITRAGGRHVAFGQGIHFCVGAALARLETSVAITTFFERYPSAR
jgi:cytochrome P450